MMMDAAALLPNISPSGGSVRPEKADREEGAGRHIGQRSAKTAQEQNVRPHTGNVDEVDSASDSTGKAIARHKESFEDTLKKHLGRKEAKQSASEAKDGTEAEAAAAGIAAMIHSSSPSPIGLKSVMAPAGDTLTAQRKSPVKISKKVFSGTVQGRPVLQNAVQADGITANPKPAVSTQENGPKESDKAGKAVMTASAVTPKTQTPEPKADIAKPQQQQEGTGQPISQQHLSNTEKGIVIKETATLPGVQTLQPSFRAAAVDQKSGTPVKMSAASDPVSAKVPGDAENARKSSLRKDPLGRERELDADSKDSASLSAVTKLQTDVEDKDSIQSGHPFRVVVAPEQTPSTATTSAGGSAPTTQATSEKGVSDIAAGRPVDQIVQTLQLRTFGAESQVRMMLAPETLGAIRMTFRQADGEVVGLLEVQKMETRKEIERSVGQLTAAMESAGVQIRRIEVIPMSSNNQSGKGEAFSQGFDAADHREMSRFSEGQDSQGFYDREFTRKSTDPTGTEKSTEKMSERLSETGLNIYM